MAHSDIYLYILIYCAKAHSTLWTVRLYLLGSKDAKFGNGPPRVAWVPVTVKRDVPFYNTDHWGEMVFGLRCNHFFTEFPTRARILQNLTIVSQGFALWKNMRFDDSLFFRLF